VSEQKTMRVRIAVAVDSRGLWSAYGCNNLPTETAIKFVQDDLGRLGFVSFIEAEVPIPEQTIEGTVVDG